LPEKKYVDGMKLKDSNRKRNIVITGIVGMAIVTALIIISKKIK